MGGRGGKEEVTREDGGGGERRRQGVKEGREGRAPHVSLPLLVCYGTQGVK